MTNLFSELRHAFAPLPRQLKVAVAVGFAWMLLFSAVGTVAFFKAQSIQTSRYHEQQKTAATARESCERALVFGPPFLNHLERVEEKLHTGTLELSVEWPVHSKEKVSVLSFYRDTIPKSCPAS